MAGSELADEAFVAHVHASVNIDTESIGIDKSLADTACRHIQDTWNRCVTMHDLLASTEEHPTYRLTIGGEANAEIESQLRSLPGVVKVEQLDGRPEYRISYDWTATTTNQLLSGILGLNLVVQGFTLDRRHLNDAFMDLTSRGIRWCS